MLQAQRQMQIGAFEPYRFDWFWDASAGLQKRDRAGNDLCLRRLLREDRRCGHPQVGMGTDLDRRQPAYGVQEQPRRQELHAALRRVARVVGVEEAEGFASAL